MIRSLFKRIDLRLPDISARDIKGDLINDYGTLKNFQFKDPDVLKILLQDRIRFHIPAQEFHLVEITGGVDVHIDGVETGLSYYLDTDGSITKFWHGDPSLSQRTSYKDANGQTHYNKTSTWDRKDLALLDSFHAKNGDCFLMNVKFPHSVDEPTGTRPRYLLKWHWDHDFDTVADSIELL